MTESSNDNRIDLKAVAGKLWERRKFFLLKLWPITFVVSCIYILGIPRYYQADAVLAPELGNTAGGALGSLASSFGINIDNADGGDAINPLLYPNLMDDNGFVTGLFGIVVTTEDGPTDITYYDYLRKHQQASLWSYPMRWLKSLLPKEDVKGSSDGGGAFNPYDISKADDDVCQAIRGNIKLSFNEKLGVIGITTKAQDRKVAKTLADSVQVHLQQYITHYRTNKARIDVEHYEQLTEAARQDYLKACESYALYADANNGIVMTRVRTKVENMEKDMQMKYTTFTTMAAQFESAKARLQERTPAFTQLKGASVPLKPAGPKRMLFVLAMLVLATVASCTVTLRKELLKIIQMR